MKLINPVVPKWKELEKDFKKIVKSKELTTGTWTKKVEEKIKKIHNCKYCLVVSSATNAFYLLLNAVNKLYSPSKCVMQDFTWQSTKDIAKLFFKDSISFVDVDKSNWISKEPSSKNVLFIPNMTFGSVETFKHKKTIYDSSHCLGNNSCNGRGYGEIISFSPAKMITACEGGCIITNNKKIYYEALTMRRYHGRISEFNSCFFYHNLDNLNIKVLEKSIIDNLYFCNLDKYETWKPSYKFPTYPNEIVYTHPKMNKKRRREMSKLFDIRLRYKPSNKLNKNSMWIYKHQIVLPSVDGKKQMEVIKKLNEICK